jgi:hypothetical protein
MQGLRSVNKEAGRKAHFIKTLGAFRPLLYLNKSLVM